MNPTALTLAEHLKITEREIASRQKLVSLSTEEQALLLAAKPSIAEQVEEIVEEFYAQQLRTPEIADLIGDAETLARLKNFMRQYILTLFDGLFDMEYVLSRLRIGMVHNRIGVSPKLYISGIWNLLDLLVGSMRGLPGKTPSTIGALHGAITKIVLFDLTLVFDTYIHSMVMELERKRAELESYTGSLEETVRLRTEELANLARMDGLTGLLNRRSFNAELRRELSRGLRKGEPLSLLYFDLDGFKRVNDQQGHLKGDEILTRTARVLREVGRAEDLLARYGGDEFCVILPGAACESARLFADRLVAAFTQEMHNEGVTLSIGIAEASVDQPVDGDTLVKTADTAMYQAKKRPGHAVVVAGPGQND